MLLDSSFTESKRDVVGYNDWWNDLERADVPGSGGPHH